MNDARNAIIGQRNWLERLVQRIPGFRGYYGNENRREADRLLREFAVRRLDRLVTRLHEENKDAPLAELQERRERITELETVRNELRFADGGYSGFFSEIKWDSSELLESVYERDAEIVDSVVALTVTVESGDWRISDLRRELRSLRRAIDTRRDAIQGLLEE